MKDAEAPRADDPGSSISQSLLEVLRRDEPDAWDRFVSLFGPLVYGWCRRAGLQGEDSQDVGQEVFQAVARTIGRFRRERPGDTFRGWLWTITRSKINDHWRRRQQEPAGLGGTTAQRRIAQIPDEAEEPTDSSAETSLGHRALDLLREEFNETTWRAFWRLVVGRRSAAEVAEELGISRNAVYLAKSRVLRRLREDYGDLIE